MKKPLYKCCLFALLVGFVYTVNAQSKSSDDVYNKFIEIGNQDTSIKQYIHDLKPLLTIVKTDTTHLHILEGLTQVYTYNYPDSALPYAQQALQIAQKVNTVSELYACYYNSGEVFRILGDYSRAVDFFLKAYLYCQQLNNQLEIAYLNAVLSICYTNYGDYEKAQSAMYKSLAYFNKKLNSADSGLLQTVYIYAAELYEKKSQLDSAVYYGNKASQIDSNWAWIKIVLGDINVKINNCPKIPNKTR